MNQFIHFWHSHYQQAVWLCLLVLITACSQAVNKPSAEINDTSLKFHDCLVGTGGSGIQLPARCTTLPVFENRQTGRGQQIPLNIAVIPAVSRNPEPDPVFFLAGGPGEAATEAYLAVASAFVRTNLKRDIVLVDQRGTGKSNRLDCPNAPSEESESEGAQPLAVKEEVAACLAELPGDPRFYTTIIAMQDLDEVRQALGYNRINLYGASYGTRAALVYARLFPDSVRSMVLDGVAPLDWSIGPDAAGDAQQALAVIFSRCQADKACNQAFPIVELEFENLLKRLEDSPAMYTLPDIVSGKPVTSTMTSGELANTVHLMSYTSETAALLPQMLHQAYTWQDYRPLASLNLMNQTNLAQNISTGMRLSILCAEDVPFWGPIKQTESYLSQEFLANLQEICSAWPTGSVPDDFKQPVVSNVPVLLLSGEADPVTPPRNARQAGLTLPNSLSLVLPGQAHINVTRDCLPEIVFNFFSTGSQVGLDTQCLQASQPLPFFINLNGPTP